MIDIVGFEKRTHDTLIGYRQNNVVVYASVPSNLDDARAKQTGYEQVRAALAYEQTLINPSIDGSDMEPIEVFTPANPVTVSVRIKGPIVVTFDDEAADKTVNYTAIAYDQYSDVVTSQTIEQTFNNADSNEVVSATIDGVATTLNVTVQAYKMPVASELEILKEDVNATAEMTAAAIESVEIVAGDVAVVMTDTIDVAETLALALVEIENLKAEISALKGE